MKKTDFHQKATEVARALTMKEHLHALQPSPAARLTDEDRDIFNRQIFRGLPSTHFLLYASSAYEDYFHFFMRELLRALRKVG